MLEGSFHTTFFHLLVDVKIRCEAISYPIKGTSNRHSGFENETLS